MWTVVFVSQDKDKTERIALVLRENEIMARLQVSRGDDFSMETMYEVLVPQTELETAQDLICDSEIISKK